MASASWHCPHACALAATNALHRPIIASAPFGQPVRSPVRCSRRRVVRRRRRSGRCCHRGVGRLARPRRASMQGSLLRQIHRMVPNTAVPTFMIRRSLPDAHRLRVRHVRDRAGTSATALFATLAPHHRGLARARAAEAPSPNALSLVPLAIAPLPTAVERYRRQPRPHPNPPAVTVASTEPPPPRWPCHSPSHWWPGWLVPWPCCQSRTHCRGCQAVSWETDRAGRRCRGRIVSAYCRRVRSRHGVDETRAKGRRTVTVLVKPIAVLLLRDTLCRRRMRCSASEAVF